MKKVIIVLFLISFPALILFATGASHMAVIIEPIGINSNGSVLCKSSHYLNKEGAHMQMPLTYSFLVIFENGSIQEYEWHYIDTFRKDEWSVIKEELDYWNRVFTETSLTNLPGDYLYLMTKYDFSDIEIKKYEVNEIVDRGQLYKRFDVQVANPQITIKDHHSDSSFNQIFIKYNFPGFVLTSNRFNAITEKEIGSTFNFHYSYPHVDGNLNYAIFTIDAFMLKNKI